MDELEEIIGEFITEAEESLDRVDPLFVELEQRGQDKELLNDIFRVVHTLKGAAGFLGFQKIVDVAHRAESILKRLRDGEITLSKELMDVILRSVDTLRLLISHIKLKDGIEEDTSDLLRDLDSALVMVTGGASKEIKGVIVEETEEVEEKKVDKGEAIQPQPEMGLSFQSQPVVEERSQQITRDREVVSTLRVDVLRIDKVMDFAGEIVLARNRLLNLAGKLDLSYSGDPYVESLLETAGFLDRVTSELQLAVMKMRMQPVQKVFSKFPRVVRDLSRNLGKEIDLEIFGEDTEVDKTVIENIGDPLVHIIRNSIDHGIESAEERLSKGKPKNGKITMSAYQKGTQIVIEVNDDGRGIDIEAVKRKALSRNLITEDEFQKMKDEAAVDLIFLPGFSTKDVSTEVSGRGVGMDVVKTNVSKLNGYVEVITKKDVGTTFRISLPLTLAIIQAMMVRIGGEYYAIPQTMIEETLRIKKDEINEVTGQKVLTIRGKILPMFDMSEILGARKEKRQNDSGNIYVLVAAVGGNRFCLSVDELLGQEEIVIKTINGIDAEGCGILGATITGDGRVVLIIDLAVISRGIFKMNKQI